MADGTHRGNSGRPSGTPGDDATDDAPDADTPDTSDAAGATGAPGAPTETGKADQADKANKVGETEEAEESDTGGSGDASSASSATDAGRVTDATDASDGEAGDAGHSNGEDPESAHRRRAVTSDTAGTSERSVVDEESGAASGSRRYPVVTRTTSRPQGGSRVAAGSSPAPFRQWPLLTVLGGALLGLLVLPLSFRVGLLVVGGALLAGAVLRLTLPAVGMLAVRSRFTDVVTYGLLGTLTVLLTVMAQPRPWLEVPFLKDVLRFSAGG